MTCCRGSFFITRPKLGKNCNWVVRGSVMYIQLMAVHSETTGLKKCRLYDENTEATLHKTTKKTTKTNLFALVSSLWVTVACLITAYNILFSLNAGFSTVILLSTQQIQTPTAIRTALTESRMISRGDLESLIHTPLGVTGVVILIQINNPLVAACKNNKINQNYRINSTPIHP